MLLSIWLCRFWDRNQTSIPSIKTVFAKSVQSFSNDFFTNKPHLKVYHYHSNQNTNLSPHVCPPLVLSRTSPPEYTNLSPVKHSRTLTYSHVSLNTQEYENSPVSSYSLQYLRYVNSYLTITNAYLI